MAIADGPEERLADTAEYYEGSVNAIEKIEQREREQLEDTVDLDDTDLLDIAEARMTAFWIDRVLG